MADGNISMPSSALPCCCEILTPEHFRTEGNSMSHSETRLPLAEEIDEGEYFNESLLNSDSSKTDSAAILAEESSRNSVPRLAEGVTPPTLPTVGIAKKLGTAPANGVGGFDSVRQPIDQLARAVAASRCQQPKRPVAPLPRVRLTVLPHGLSIDDLDRSSGSIFYPIETVSYVAMDTRMPRLFCFVSVEIAVSPPKSSTGNTGASVSRTMAMNPACHAFLCASVLDCHRLVLAARLAFNSSVNRAKAAAVTARRRQRQESNEAGSVGSAGEDGVAATSRVVNLAAFSGDIEEA